jgi:hypothetical protein
MSFDSDGNSVAALKVEVQVSLFISTTPLPLLKRPATTFSEALLIQRSLYPNVSYPFTCLSHRNSSAVCLPATTPLPAPACSLLHLLEDSTESPAQTSLRTRKHFALEHKAHR